MSERIYRGSRCGTCYWALYDGDYCQNPSCVHYGKSIEGDDRIKLTNEEAALLIAIKVNKKPPTQPEASSR